jgi:hypothetical protein
VVNAVNDALVVANASGCVINFKTAWQAAVLGGFTMGTIGGYIGATGGTVVLPFVGTVTGGIGGFVFGFASGFASGAILSIAQDLIFKCLLKATRLVTGNEQCSEFDFFSAHSEWCNEYNSDRIYMWHL